MVDVQVVEVFRNGVSNPRVQPCNSYEEAKQWILENYDRFGLQELYKTNPTSGLREQVGWKCSPGKPLFGGGETPEYVTLIIKDNQQQSMQSAQPR